MKFYSMINGKPVKENYLADFDSAHEIGIIRVGTENLYFRRLRKIYFIPYTEISRCFRRVMMVPAKLCCGSGDLNVENLVICHGNQEIAQIQLPGTKAARLLLEELKEKAPGIDFSSPSKPREA